VLVFNQTGPPGQAYRKWGPLHIHSLCQPKLLPKPIVLFACLPAHQISAAAVDLTSTDERKGPWVDDEVGGVEHAWHGDGADDELEVVRAEGDGGRPDGLGCADVLKKGKMGDEGRVRLKFESQPGILSW
jgi:hypothetical protein